MSAERKPDIGTDAWFKELENRLKRVATLLDDAALQAARSLSKGTEIYRDLSAVQELIARIEDRVARTLAAAAGGEPTAPQVDALCGAVDYRDVPDFPGYRVGDDGSVWGARRAGRGYGRTREWRALKPYLVRPGPAPTVSLYRERVRHSLRVDSVVLLAFTGPCPGGWEVEHANGDLLDNRLENLRYFASKQSVDAALLRPGMD
jgi:HNH endonuclease